MANGFSISTCFPSARASRKNSNVPFGWNGNHHRVDVIAAEELAGVGVGVRDAELARDSFGGAPDDVRAGHQFGAGMT